MKKAAAPHNNPVCGGSEVEIIAAMKRSGAYFLFL
jgi:hypothetical protein